MTDEQLKEIEDKISKVWNSSPYKDIAVEATTIGQTAVSINVSQMYKYVPLGLKELLGVARAIDTDRFEVDQWSSDGCETCDYGSNYSVQFRYELDNVGHWDIQLNEAPVQNGML